MALRVSISPAIADEQDHSAYSSESQAILLPVVCASTWPTSLEAPEGRTPPTYFISVPCEPGAEPIIETMLVTDKSMGKKPMRNQKASSAARSRIFSAAALRRAVRISSRQLDAASLRKTAIWLPHCPVLLDPPLVLGSLWGVICSHHEAARLRVVRHRDPSVQNVAEVGLVLRQPYSPLIMLLRVGRLRSESDVLEQLVERREKTIPRSQFEPGCHSLNVALEMP